MSDFGGLFLSAPMELWNALNSQRPWALLVVVGLWIWITRLAIYWTFRFLGKG